MQIRYQRGGDPGYVTVETSSGRTLYNRRYYDYPNFYLNRYADYFHFMEKTSIIGDRDGVFLGVMSRDSGVDLGYGTTTDRTTIIPRIEYADNTPAAQGRR